MILINFILLIFSTTVPWTTMGNARACDKTGLPVWGPFHKTKMLLMAF